MQKEQCRVQGSGCPYDFGVIVLSTIFCHIFLCTVMAVFTLILAHLLKNNESIIGERVTHTLSVRGCDIMILKNDTDRYHLCYLFVHDISEDKYDGLSHVAEHTLLLPTDIGIGLVASGYTCLNHVYLYFGSETLEDLQIVDNKIMSGEIFTDENVSYAKSQVLNEILRLRDKTTKYKKIVSFITEGRVKNAAIGNPVEVARIQTNDIVRWFENNKNGGKLYRFLYKDAHDMIMSSPMLGISMRERKNINMIEHAGNDSFLYTVSTNKARSFRVYYRIAPFSTKTDVVKQALYEFCVQRKIQESLKIEVSIAERYFDIGECYLLLEFSWDNHLTAKDTIGMIRTEIKNISINEYKSYLKEFMDNVSTVLRQKESNSDVMNSIKNKVLYSKPQITLEDVKCIETSELDMCLKERITSMPLKVVIS